MGGPTRNIAEVEVNRVHLQNQEHHHSTHQPMKHPERSSASIRSALRSATSSNRDLCPLGPTSRIRTPAGNQSQRPWYIQERYRKSSQELQRAVGKGLQFIPLLGNRFKMERDRRSPVASASGCRGRYPGATGEERGHGSCCDPLNINSRSSAPNVRQSVSLGTALRFWSRAYRALRKFTRSPFSRSLRFIWKRSL